MTDVRPVAYVVGRILIVLAILMLAPAVIDLRAGLRNGQSFFECAVLTGLFGLLVVVSTRNTVRRGLDARQAYLLTAAIWIVLPLFAALPFFVGAPGLSFPDAYFEAVSGITTTGSTVIVGLDMLPAGMNLWRGMLNWLGGLGIAFIAMIFLPLMRIGGMQFFRTEGFDTHGKTSPRAADIARQLLYVYTGLTIICIAAYGMIGMTALDAVVNGAATIATGGFSASDLSFGKYPGAGEYVGTFFMIAGSLPYVRYVQLVNGKSLSLWQDSQVRVYLRWLFTTVALITLWRFFTSDLALEPAFRETLFNVTSIMSGTGFFSGSFAGWGAVVLITALVLGTVGACSGSSAGGLSVFRVQIALYALRQQIGQIVNPNSVSVVKYDGKTVGPDVINAVMMFVASYIMIMGVLIIAVSLVGVDTESAVFAVWTSIGNVGYGFGPMVARTGTFVDFPQGAKAILTLAMIMGRLGLLAILVLVLPAYWRR